MYSNNAKKSNLLSRQVIKTWHDQNLSVYNHFLEDFDTWSSTDASFAEKLIGLIEDSLPGEITEVWDFMIESTLKSR